MKHNMAPPVKERRGQGSGLADFVKMPRKSGTNWTRKPHSFKGKAGRDVADNSEIRSKSGT